MNLSIVNLYLEILNGKKKKKEWKKKQMKNLPKKH